MRVMVEGKLRNGKELRADRTLHFKERHQRGIHLFGDHREQVKRKHWQILH